jgi:ribosomal protein L7/L12
MAFLLAFRAWWPIIGAVTVMAIILTASWLRVAAAKRAGILPATGKATMADVKRLIRSGQSIWAIRCYRELHPEVMLREAKRIVEGMQTAA